jgi:predicted nucleotidyltransferase component of viral defense system
MIPKIYIQKWRQYAPWISEAHVEQDLIISRALVELYSQELVKKNLLFRGGTALNKLYLNPPARYSEDIDLVQFKAEPIGETLDSIRGVLDPWLGVPKRKFGKGRATLSYRYTSENEIPSRLKIEINTVEHGSLYHLVSKSIVVSSEWFSGFAEIRTYELSELMGSKMRALYCRKKGRDLFDLWFLYKSGSLSVEKLLEAFDHYMSMNQMKVSRAMFEQNLKLKMEDPAFLRDIDPLLREDQPWNVHEASSVLLDEIVALLPGEAWAGDGSA